MDLLPREKRRRGRRRTVTANAWIARRDKRANWQSCVYAGTGRIHTLSTGTTDRMKALSFNRIHLFNVLNSTSSPTVVEEQLPLDLQASCP